MSNLSAIFADYTTKLKSKEVEINTLLVNAKSLLREAQSSAIKLAWSNPNRNITTEDLITEQADCRNTVNNATTGVSSIQNKSQDIVNNADDIQRNFFAEVTALRNTGTLTEKEQLDLNNIVKEFSNLYTSISNTYLAIKDCKKSTTSTKSSVASHKALVNAGSAYEKFSMIDNYIYFYHLDKFIILPTYADKVSDSMSASWDPTQLLGRSAPIYSYSNSGPRTIQFNFDLHRDLMNDINISANNKSALNGGNSLTTDYVDTILNYLRTSVLPSYEAAQKMVNPPIVAIRMGQDLFIRGVVTSGISLTYNLPILSNGKYAYINVGFQVSEIDPYNANDIVSQGGFRGLSKTLERKIYK